MAQTASGLTVLGIETSCDETAASVVRGLPPGPGTILSNIVESQLAAHRPYGGVVPEIASRAHVELIDSIVASALKEAGLKLSEIDAVAATAGPGLIGGVMVGLLTGKALALASGKPLIAVNHLEAHALSARLAARCAFPFLLLLISGGHCQLVAAEAVGRYRLYGTTIDDALGEAFDKAAKSMGLPYPGGPAMERMAREGNPRRFSLPRPMLGRAGADFSFSGLKTAVRQVVQQQTGDGWQADLAASFQDAILAVLKDRISAAMQQFRADFPDTREPAFVAAGGVASNGAIRSALEALCREKTFALALPPAALCTDNGAMVAWAGVERLNAGLTDALDVAPLARWPLEDLRNFGQGQAGRDFSQPANRL